MDLLDELDKVEIVPDVSNLVHKHVPNLSVYVPKSLCGVKIPITKSGAFINFDQIKTKDLVKSVRKIENYFTIRTLQVLGHYKQTKRCVVDKTKKRIIVPRFGVFEVLNSKFGLSDYTTSSCLSDGEDLELKWGAILTENQQLITKYLMDNVYTLERKKCGSAGTILNLEAGQGKSYVAAWLIAQIKKRAIIILHSSSILQQWETVIKNCFGDTVTIGQYHSKKKQDGDIMLCIINSAVSTEFTYKSVDKKTTITKKPIDFYSQFGLVIMDECHCYANEFNGKVFNIAQTPYMLGLSATPDCNANKFDKLVWWGLGPVLDATTIQGYNSSQCSFNGVVHKIKYYGPKSHTKLLKNAVTDMVSVVETIAMICDDAHRNKVVIDCIKACIEKNLFTFVFADRREYLDLLRTMLGEGEVVADEAEYIRIVGGAKATDLEKAEQKSKVIFTTYQFMGTGKSIVKMNGLVLATPRKSKMEQYIKRVFRLGSDESIERHIYDIVDYCTPLKSQWSSRGKYYKEEKFTIVEEEIKILY
jgi:superfamily II DNA or RNA helicase